MRKVHDAAQALAGDGRQGFLTNEPHIGLAIVPVFGGKGMGAEEAGDHIDRALGGHRAASTLVTVPALARPEWRMEIALVAAYAEG